MDQSYNLSLLGQILSRANYTEVGGIHMPVTLRGEVNRVGRILQTLQSPDVWHRQLSTVLGL